MLIDITIAIHILALVRTSIWHIIKSGKSTALFGRGFWIIFRLFHLIVVDRLGRLRDLFAVGLLRRVSELFLGIFRFGCIALDGLFRAAGNRAVVDVCRLAGIRRDYGDLFFFLCAVRYLRIYRHIAHLGALGRKRIVHRLWSYELLSDQHHQHRTEGKASGYRQPFLRFVIHIFHKSVLLFVKF
ncbi:hypothetical protein SDC9_121938 [bioreactor metagenome]|uniref:Uncharacterized protein n=1 Tax=bioreactor metagenome TaxID=1076179 RepID=A0A645CDC8_9ZZZZ